MIQEIKSASIDDIAAKLPSVEFRQAKKPDQFYNQKMQSLRGGRQFLLRTFPLPGGKLNLRLMEYISNIGEEITIGNRTAQFDNAESIVNALKSLQKKAKCKLYYVLLIGIDGEYQ